MNARTRAARSPLALAPDNPMNRVMPMITGFEIIVFALAVPGMVYVSNIDSTTAALVGAGAAVLALLASALMRRSLLGWILAWLTQVVAVLLGLMTPMMWVAGGVFAVIWVMSFVLGRRIEQGTLQGPRR